MKRNSLLYSGLVLAISLWALNVVALEFYFYWTIWWYDYMMHFLGGLTLGVIVSWALRVERRTLKSFVYVFIWVMILSVIWEIFEYKHDIAALPSEYWLDTTHDLIMDTVGMIVAYYFATRSTISQLR